MIVHEKNLSDIQKLSNFSSYADKIILRHRWWFPEFDGTYRNLTPKKIVTIITNRESIRNITKYWLNRKGVEDKIGSENSFIFVTKEIYPEISVFDLSDCTPTKSTKEKGI